jgi:hypothetical protein
MLPDRPITHGLNTFSCVLLNNTSYKDPRYEIISILLLLPLLQVPIFTSICSCQNVKDQAVQQYKISIIVCLTQSEANPVTKEWHVSK